VHVLVTNPPKADSYHLRVYRADVSTAYLKKFDEPKMKPTDITQNELHIEFQTIQLDHPNAVRWRLARWLEQEEVV
jgi:hypothetical protein